MGEYFFHDGCAVNMLKRRFTQVIFVAATRVQFLLGLSCNIRHVQNPRDITATNHNENHTWFTCAILKLQL